MHNGAKYTTAKSSDGCRTTTCDHRSLPPAFREAQIAVFTFCFMGGGDLGVFVPQGNTLHLRSEVWRGWVHWCRAGTETWGQKVKFYQICTKFGNINASRRAHPWHDFNEIFGDCAELQSIYQSINFICSKCPEIHIKGFSVARRTRLRPALTAAQLVNYTVKKMKNSTRTK